MGIWRRNSTGTWSRVPSIWRKNQDLPGRRPWARVNTGWRRTSTGGWQLFYSRQGDDFSTNPTLTSNATAIDPAFTNQDFISSSVVTLTRGTVDSNEGTASTYTMGIYKYETLSNIQDAITPNPRTFPASQTPLPTLQYTITAADARVPSKIIRGKVFAQPADESQTFYFPPIDQKSKLYISVDNISIPNVFSANAELRFRAFVRGAFGTFQNNTDFIRSIRVVVNNGVNPETRFAQSFNGLPLPAGHTQITFEIRNNQNSLDPSGANFSALIPTTSTSSFMTVYVDCYDDTQTVYSAIASLPPTNTVLPSISPTFGVVDVTTFTCDPGTWAPTPTNYQYQWQFATEAPFTDVLGQTNQTWTPDSFYIGASIRCRVRASVDGGNTYSAYVNSSNSAEVLGPALIPTFGANTPTLGGFTGSVTNYNTGYDYNIPSVADGTLTAGIFTWGPLSTPVRTFSVTGLSAGQSSTVTVTTSRTGHLNGSASTTGAARNTYIVTWDANGGTVSPTSSSVIIGQSVTAPTPSRTNWTALNNAWWTDPLGPNQAVAFGAQYTPTSDIILYARWRLNAPTNLTFSNVTPSSLTVSWTGNSSTLSYELLYIDLEDPNAFPVTISNITTTSRNISGLVSNRLYSFSVRGWSGSNNTGSVSDYTTATQRTDAIQYTVTWNATTNGGTVTPTSSTVNQGQSVIAPTATRANSTFNGWFTASSGGTFVVSGGGSYTPISSITLFAQFTTIQYTVTWNANGGTVSPTSSTVNAGDVVFAPIPTRSGFTFNGWFNAATGGSLVTPGGVEYQPTSSITLFARWTAIVPVLSSWRAVDRANNLGIYADSISGTNVGSVNWQIRNSAGAVVASGTENVPTSNLTHPGINNTLNAAQYRIVMTPYFGSNGTGTAGTTRTGQLWTLNTLSGSPLSILGTEFF